MKTMRKWNIYAAVFLITANTSYAAPKGSIDQGAPIPHMDVSTYPSQIFWLMVSFALLYFLMYKKVLPQIQYTIERRQNTIESNLEKAAKLRDKAEDLKISYDKSLRQAHNHANEFLENSLADMNDKNSSELEKAMDKILASVDKSEVLLNQQKEKAMAQANSVAQNIAQALTNKVLELQNIPVDKTRKKS